MASADQISFRNLGRRSGRRPLWKAQASRRAAKRPRPRPRGMGGNRRKNHPKRRTAPATTQAALSEAESAEREAGQIRFLPDDLRVQHGAEGPEVSVRPRPCSRRGRRVSGQDRLEPHPPAARGRREAFFLSTAPPSLSFCRLQKDYARRRVPEATAALRRLLAGGKWGWKAPGLCPHPPVGQPSPNPRRKATKAPSRSAAPAA